MDTDRHVPNDWSDAVEEIAQRRQFARAMGGDERVARQHSQGKLTVRERIERFLDPGTFFEVGGMVGEGRYGEGGKLEGFAPGAYVMGFGDVDGRVVCVGGEDFTVSGGSGGAHKRPSNFIQPFALEYRVPLVQFADGAGASARNYDQAGRMSLPDGKQWALDTQLLATVPVVSAIMGPAAGHVAGRAVLSHFSVMVRGNGQIFASGPPVVKRALGQDVTKEELGGVDVHVRTSGVVDNEAIDEEDAFRQVRAFLSYLPQNVFEVPPRRETGDPPERREEKLLSIVPRERQRGYDMRALLRLVVDRGELFELRPSFAPNLITAFARMDGYPVGVVAHNPRVFAGALTVQAADKHTRFVDLCNAFNLPLVLFVDTPGFMIGKQAEQSGLLRAGMRAVVAGVQAKVPHVAIYVRKSYGMAGDAIGCIGGASSVNLRFGWPSGEWGSIPIEGGVAAAYRRQIESAPDPEAARLEIERRLQANRSPFRVAEAFEILDIVDPRETRPLVCRFVAMAQAQLARLTSEPKAAVRP